jgi:hypothetical protein
MMKIMPMPPRNMVRHKMPLEVAPFFSRLIRSEAIVNPTATANGATAARSN